MSSHDETEMIAEDELFELFEARRPDRADFRAGVQERIEREAQRENERESEANPNDHSSTWWRRVASVLPIDPFGGAFAGSIFGKAFGGKLLPGVLALPVLVLAAAFGGFVMGARALARSSAGAQPVATGARGHSWKYGSNAYRARAKSGSVYNLIQFGAMLALCATWLFGGSFAIDVLMALLVLSMLALVLTVANLSMTGALTRPDITRVASNILSSVFVGCFLWFNNMRIADEASNLGIGVAASVILMGVVVAYAFGGQWGRGLVALAVGLGAMWLLNVPGVTHTSPVSLRSQLANIGLETSDLGRWRDAAALHGALEVLEADQPDLSQVRASLSTAMRSDDDVHPVVWMSGHSMGLISDEDWGHLAQRKMQARKLDKLLTPGFEFPRTRYQQYVLPMLLATREVDVEERQLLAEKVLATWPTTGEHGAPTRALGCLRSLEELGREDLIDGLREKALALLSDHWISGKGAKMFANVGGFSPNPEKFNTSMHDDTLHGIELMARFGVPERVDLYLMRSYLRRECHSIPVLGMGKAYLRAEARASFVRLNEQIGMPQRSWFENMLAERLLMASILIVLLCLIAIRLAPPVIDVPEVVDIEAGALP